MNIVWLGSVLYDPNIYHRHKSPGLRDSAAPTADREVQSAGPPILLTSVDTHFGCRPRGLTIIQRKIFVFLFTIQKYKY